jgi:hypothetical protein
VNTKFDFSAAVASPSGQLPSGALKSEGWVNFVRKDMLAKISVQNLDGSLFRPFYKDFLSEDVRGVTVNLSTDLVSKNNDMVVKGQLSLKSHAVKKDEPKDDSFSIEDFVLKGLQSSGMEIVTNFHFKTKMDSFKIDSIPFSGKVQTGTAVENNAQEIPPNAI